MNPDPGLEHFVGHRDNDGKIEYYRQWYADVSDAILEASAIQLREILDGRGLETTEVLVDGLPFFD